MGAGTLFPMTSIAIIGGGTIGEALIAGLVAAGTPAESITVSNRREERGAELRERYGVVDVLDNPQAISGAEVIFLCVKPAQVVGVLGEIADALENSDGNPVVVSMAAGVSLAKLQESVAAGAAIIRAMPNTPMLVGKGFCSITPSRFVDEDQLAQVRELLGTVATVVELPEKNIHAVTALAGSAPAYFFLVTEALVDAGVSLGLKRDTALTLATSAAEGAGAMLAQEGADPAALRAGVSSPAGTTVAALRELEESGLRGAFFRATEACARRSEEMGCSTPARRVGGELGVSGRSAGEGDGEGESA